jgi:hypothetical protein
MRLANRSSSRAITLANPGEAGEGALIVHPSLDSAFNPHHLPAGRAKLERSQILMHAHSLSMASRSLISRAPTSLRCNKQVVDG